MAINPVIYFAAAAGILHSRPLFLAALILGGGIFPSVTPHLRRPGVFGADGDVQYQAHPGFRFAVLVGDVVSGDLYPGGKRAAPEGYIEQTRNCGLCQRLGVKGGQRVHRLKA